MSNRTRVLGFVLLVAYGCRHALSPVPPPDHSIRTSTPIPLPLSPVETKAIQLEESLSGQGYDKVASELQKSSDDPKLSAAIKPLNEAIDDAKRKIHELKSRGEEMTSAEREEYNELAMKLAEARQVREELIETSYTSYRVEYKDLNRTWMQPESEHFLLRHLSELKAACTGRRKVIVMGFGCSIGSEEATDRVSGSRAADVNLFLIRRAGCVKEELRSKGLGVETPKEDLEGIDSGEVEHILQKSRFVRLLLPSSTLSDRPAP